MIIDDIIKKYEEKRHELFKYGKTVIIELPLIDENNVLLFEAFKSGQFGLNGAPLYNVVIANSKYGIVVTDRIIDVSVIDPTLKNAYRLFDYNAEKLMLYYTSASPDKLGIPYLIGKTLTIDGILVILSKIMWRLDKLFAAINAFYPSFAELAESAGLARLLKEYKRLTTMRKIKIELDDYVSLTYNITESRIIIETPNDVTGHYSEKFKIYDEKYDITKRVKSVLTDEMNKIDQLIAEFDQVLILLKLAGVR